MIFKNLFSKEEEIITGNHIDAGPLTLKKMAKLIKKREKITSLELDGGYALIEQYPRTVSVLGSARFGEDNRYYKEARSLAYRIVKELKYAIVTGGGPGIMEAANRGAYEAEGASLGITIKLPKEQHTNKYVTKSADFEYFFDRKALLFFSAEAYVYYPGGFGTLDEFFELVTLIQTKKINKRPVILVGKDFWQPLLEFIEKELSKENNTINVEDMQIYKIVDSEDEVLEIIKQAPKMEE